MNRRTWMSRLAARPHTVAELARVEGIRPREVEEELDHVFRTVRRAGGRVVVDPARCRKCGFEFDARTLGRPSRCPGCRGTWIAEARIGLVLSGSDGVLDGPGPVS